MEGMEKLTAVEQFILDLQEHFPNHMNSMYNNNQLLLEQLTLKAKEMEKAKKIKAKIQGLYLASTDVMGISYRISELEEELKSLIFKSE